MSDDPMINALAEIGCEEIFNPETDPENETENETENLINA